MNMLSRVRRVGLFGFVLGLLAVACATLKEPYEYEHRAIELSVEGGGGDLDPVALISSDNIRGYGIGAGFFPFPYAGVQTAFFKEVGGENDFNQAPIILDCRQCEFVPVWGGTHDGDLGDDGWRVEGVLQVPLNAKYLAIAPFYTRGGGELTWDTDQQIVEEMSFDTWSAGVKLYKGPFAISGSYRAIEGTVERPENEFTEAQSRGIELSRVAVAVTVRFGEFNLLDLFHGDDDEAAPPAEACDGVDNDADGETDENCPPPQQPAAPAPACVPKLPQPFEDEGVQWVTVGQRVSIPPEELIEVAEGVYERVNKRGGMRYISDHCGKYQAFQRKGETTG
jgi:hypothetical protein